MRATLRHRHNSAKLIFTAEVFRKISIWRFNGYASLPSREIHR